MQYITEVERGNNRGEIGVKKGKLDIKRGRIEFLLPCSVFVQVVTF